MTHYHSYSVLCIHSLFISSNEMQLALAWGLWTAAVGEMSLFQWCDITCCWLWLPQHRWERAVPEEWQYYAYLNSGELACIFICYVESFTYSFSFCLSNSLQKQMPHSVQEAQHMPDTELKENVCERMFVLWNLKHFLLLRKPSCFALCHLEPGGDHVVLGKEETDNKDTLKR